MDIFDTKGIHPMLIAEQVDPYDDQDSIFELKLDGIRCLAYCDNNSVDLRNKRDIKLLPRFPELKSLYTGCKQKCILDGELNVLVNGKTDFYEIQKRTLLTDQFKIKLAYTKYPSNFVVYDILYYKNREVVDLPLIERKSLIHDNIMENDILAVSRYIENDGVSLFNLAKQNGMEGVVGKKKNSLYWYGKRTKDWKKIKVMKDKEFVVVGYIPKPNNMTSLVLALYNDENQLVITNHVTLGVSLAKLKSHGMTVSECSVSNVPSGHENTIWISPMVCTVEYMPSEREGMRQAVFKGIRDDKLPEECRMGE